MDTTMLWHQKIFIVKKGGHNRNSSRQTSVANLQNYS
jgi:hypothetical protein